MPCPFTDEARRIFVFNSALSTQHFVLSTGENIQATDHLHDHSHHDHEHDHNHARENAQEWIKTAILFALGFYFIYVIASGNLSNYINARFEWLSYVAAGLFLMVWAISIHPFKIFVNSITRHMGKISYSAYLVHFLALQLVAYFLDGFLIAELGLGFSIVKYLVFLVVTLGVTVLISNTTYGFIEKHGRQLGAHIISALEKK